MNIEDSLGQSELNFSFSSLGSKIPFTKLTQDMSENSLACRKDFRKLGFFTLISSQERKVFYEISNSDLNLPLEHKNIRYTLY
jgi:hypothetical protein